MKFNNVVKQKGISSVNGLKGESYGMLIPEERRMVKDGKWAAFGSDLAMRNLIASSGYLTVFLGVTELLQKVFDKILTSTGMHTGIMEEMSPIFPIILWRRM